MRKFIACILMIIAVAVTSLASEPIKWQETTKVLRQNTMVSERTLPDGIEIYAADGTIYVRIQGKETVKVFTILGQLVNRSTLAQGTWELKINSRGIYIIKIGNHTQKVAL